MIHRISRRGFLQGSVAAGATAVLAPSIAGAITKPEPASEFDFPVVDYHAHIDADFPLEKALQIAKERGVKFGVVEHAGVGQPLADDQSLKRYLARLEGQPVFKGVQAEWLDWPKCFSKEVVAQLDYVLSDALTFPEKDGRRVHIWTPEIQITDKQDFMDRYVDFNARVIAEEPIDIMANPTFLPEAIVAEYDALWTDERMRKVIDAAAKYRVAIEINSRYNIPSVKFLKLARAAGIKFTFGSNAHGEDAGKLDYSLKVARDLKLTRRDMFTPAPAGKKPILWRA
jgi:histidinol phosphatase-like PHP family hydrolase